MAENGTGIVIANTRSEHFASKIGNDFALVHDEWSLPVTLAVHRENPEAAGPDSQRTPFLLVFRADLDENNPLQHALEFHGAIHGLADGPIDGLLINRTLRPSDQPEGAYFQVAFA